MGKTGKLLRYVFGAILAAYVLWIIAFEPSPLQEQVSGWYLIAIAFLASAYSFYLSGRKGYKLQLRRAWFFFGLALMGEFIAESLWLYFSNIGIEPFPSIADFFYISYYVFLLIGVLSLPYQPLDNRRKILVALDVTVVILAGMLFLYYFILAPMAATLSSNQGWIESIMALAYPGVDLLVLAALLSLLQRDAERVNRTVLILLSGSMIITGIADLTWSVTEVWGLPDLTIQLNALWMGAIWLHLFAAQKQIEASFVKEPEQDAFRPLLRDILVYLAPAAAFLLLLLSSGDVSTTNPRHYVVTIFSVILVAVVMLRQYVILQENRRLYVEMSNLAVRDQLTGVFNRRAFDQFLEQEIRRAERFGHPLSLLVMDLDGFKRYNDTYGHLGGDMILKRVARTLQSRLRSVDIIARYGGDEFVAILPETTAENSYVIAERLRDAVTAAFITENITITIGCGTWQPGQGADDLIAVADKELYALKAQR